MPTIKTPPPRLKKHKQIFYDPTGNRWRLSIFISSLFIIIIGIILAIGIPSGITIASIQDQGTKPKVTNTKTINLNKKSTVFYTPNTEKSIISLKENNKDIENLVLPWLEVKKVENKILVNRIETTETKLVDEVVEKNNPNINKLLLLSDNNYTKPSYENRYNGDTFKDLIDKKELQEDFINSLNLATNTNNYKGIIIEIQDKTIDKKYEEYKKFLQKISINLSNKNLAINLKLNIFDDLKLIEISKQFSNTVILESYQEPIFNKNPATVVDSNYYQPKINFLPIQTSFEQLNKVLSAFPDIKYSIALPTQSVDIYLVNNKPSWQSQISFAEVGDIIQKYNPDIKYNSLEGVSSFEYKDEKDQQHQIIINDAIAVYNFLYNLNLLSKPPISIDLENIGFEDPTTWQITQSKNNQDSQEILRNKLLFSTEIETTGAGVISQLKKNPKFGKREIQMIDDKIINTKITELPTKALLVKSGYKKDYIALTFDDGPDPKYTPQILDILKANNIKASFFVVGSNVLEYPELAQRIVNEGHLLGNHTYTHPKLKNAQPQEIIDEIESTQKAIQEITNTTPKYFRTPFNDFGTYETNSDLKQLRVIDGLNLKIAESDLDSNDYRVQKVEEILNSIKNGFNQNQSSQILFHDSGGFTRQSTVDALPEVIKFLKEKKIQFITVSELDDISQKQQKDSVEVNKDYLFYSPKLIFLNLLNKSDLVFRLLLFIATTLGLIRLTILIIGLIKHFNVKKITTTNPISVNSQPGVSVLIPCYNEEKVICRTVESILNSKYTTIEIVIIDDCSTDDSLKLIRSKYYNNPKVTILTKPNGGKAEALNFGIQFAKYDYLVSMDADTMFLPDTVNKMMQLFADPKVGGVAGFVEIGNDYFYQKSQNKSQNNNSKFNWLTTCQRLEYIFGQNFDKQAYNGLGCVIVVPGAIGAWRKSIILDVGGYKTDTLAEDTDLTVRILRKGWKIKYCKDAFCVTEAPETIQQFWKQRIRWQFGTLQVIFKNLDIIFKPKYKTVSMFAIPYLFFNFFSMLVSPIANLPFFILLIKLYAGAKVGFLVFNSNDYTSIQWMFVFIIGYLGIEYISTIFAIWQYKLKGKWILLFFIPVQILVFRLLILIITITSILKAFEGKVVGWGHLQRTGNVSEIKSTVS